MLAVGLSVLIFSFWTVVGSAVLALLNRQEHPTRNLLLAPAVGVATTLLPIFWLNRLGLPIRQFDIFLTLVLLALSGGIFWRFRVKLVWREYIPFAGILFLALLTCGRPMLEFGFDWLSYTNDDMANYSLAGHFFLDHGFFERPKVLDFLNGYDYTIRYWFFYVLSGVRVGSELLLAWMIGLTGLTAYQIFMPVMLAYHLTLISVTGAFVFQGPALRPAALLTCFLLSLSANSSLGTLYQLLGQVNGLGQLVACLLIILQPSQNLQFRTIISRGALAGLLVASLLIIYPEVSPFLGIPYGMYLAIAWVRQRLSYRNCGLFLGTTILCTLLLLNTYIATPFSFLLNQVSTGLKGSESKFFYYLIPAGLSNLWGISGIHQSLTEPWLSISILLGAILLTTVTVAAIVLLWDGQPVAIVTAFILIVALSLFIRKNDFGLFKVAMFIQPFMLGTLAIAWTTKVKHQHYKVAPLILVGLLSVPGQSGYVERSRGLELPGLVEIPNASRSRINSEFKELLERNHANNLILDTSNIVLAKFQALNTQGKQTIFPSYDFFGLQKFYRTYLNYGSMTAVTPLKNFLKTSLLDFRFDLLDPDNPGAKNPFTVIDFSENSFSASKERFLVKTLPSQSIFNRWQVKIPTTENFALQPLNTVTNWLMFISSLRGKHFYLGEQNTTSFFQLEPDWFYPGQTFAGMGRYSLFRVINPSQTFRVAMSITASLQGDGQNLLPNPIAIGAERQPLPVTGRGSARVFSPPLTSQLIAGQPYLSIDMGALGQQFADRRSGVARLYGNDFTTDSRKIVGFVRDISLVSEADYQHRNLPARLEKFPLDLANPDLDYSGFYEDGWISESAFVSLDQPSNTSQFILQGSVYALNNPSFRTELKLLLDGQEVARKVLSPGEFAFAVRLASPPGRHRIDLRSSHIQSLPGSDRRPTAFQVKFLGFVTDTEAANLPSQLNQFPESMANPYFERSGIFGDGWVSEAVRLRLSQPQSTSQFVVQGKVPEQGGQPFMTELQLLVDGVEVSSQALKSGDFIIKANVSPERTVRQIELKFSQAQTLQPPDRRRVAAQLQFIGFQ